MRIPLRELETAFALEAQAHAMAAAELNPFGEAEALELGDARAVYSGQWSPVHGVIGLGLEAPVSEQDLREVERFYFRKERAPAFWITPATDPTLLDFLKNEYQETRKQPVFGWDFQGEGPQLPMALGSSQPDHNEWATTFTRMMDPAAKEAGLLALTKIHQANTRFYLGAQGASYTFFSRGVALAPLAGPPALLALQLQEAKGFHSAFFVTGTPGIFPLLYERALYERI